MQTPETESTISPTTRVLTGRHALVTGASRGIGAAIADRLAGMGAALSMLGRDVDRLRSRQAEIETVHGVDTHAVVADITDAEALSTAIGDAVARLGPPAILVNNAGASESAPFARTDEALLHRMMEINLVGTFRCTQLVLPAMIEAGFGRIVNIASTAGVTGYRYTSAYCAAKHAVVGLTRSLALELAKTGVTANAVCPGFTDTDLVAGAITNIVAKTGRSEADARAQLAATNPQGRLVQAGEVAAAVGWLCLPESAAVNGQTVIIDGGEVMK
ncbi:MAG: SDR family oxidoreductase [Alphaproteobacteria bacterium]|nr:SDR family oxidoreductase [Alphaproteobacteria bacterium]